MVRVAVQHRHRLLREGTSQLLAEARDIQVTGAVSSAEELLELCAESRPDVAVMQFGCAGAEALSHRLGRSHPAVRLIGLHDGQPAASELQDAVRGGMQILSHSDGIAPVMAAVLGSQVLPSQRPARVSSGEGGSLTAREASVLTLVGGGWTSTE